MKLVKINNRVYCEKCKYFKDNVFPYCSAPDNITIVHTYKRSYEGLKQSPNCKNKNNDCDSYKEHEIKKSFCSRIF